MTVAIIFSGFVQRETQIAKLDTVRHRVTLISAAAGYGKTTLAAQWNAQLSLPSAWLSADADVWWGETLVGAWRGLMEGGRIQGRKAGSARLLGYALARSRQVEFSWAIDILTSRQ